MFSLASDPGSGSRAVQNTRELARILALPRRVWTEETAAVIAKELTALLRKPRGTQELRPIQGQALLEIGCKGGLFAPIRVGGGKTLISLLSSFLLDARRPLLVVPAKLVEKTKREWRILAAHWNIPNFLIIKSYEWLGRVQANEFLDKEYQPDVIIFDEVHKVKNPKAAVTRRFIRYFKARPHTKCVAMSGTMTKRSIKDWTHIIEWVLGPQAMPVPSRWSEVEDWADALDEKTSGDKRIGTGFLSLLCNGEELREDPLTGVRKGFRRRLVETSGVVASTEGHLGCSLSINAIEVNVKDATNQAFDLLRKTWTTPDGWPLINPLDVWRTARSLAVGFYDMWEPRPPHAWMMARRAWSSVCRDILMNNRRNLDSLLMVVNAIRDGAYPQAIPILEEWREIEPSFTPNSVPVWLDDSCIEAARQWADKGPGIIWTEHVPFAERLAKVTKLSYYGRKGLDKDGRYIEDHPADVPLIASAQSNGEGRNLQHKWSRNLVVSPFPNGLQWEQVLGRTHRDGQEADEVEFDVFCVAAEHVSGFWQSVKDAQYTELMKGQAQKLLYADIMYPTPEEIAWRQEYRWQKAVKRGD